DVDENRLEMRIAQHDLECLGYFLCRRATADVEKIRRLATVELDHIHRRHRKSGTVDETTDIAVERNIREVEFGCFNLSRILLVQIAHHHDVGMSKERVGVEVELRVQSD